MNFKYRTLISTILIIVFITFVGCQKQEEKQPQQQTQTQPEVKQAPDTSKIVEPEKLNTIDLVGTWTGTFDKRPTTLKIANQKENEFNGKITINYREVINQQVSGKIDVEKMSVSMKDLLHSRFAGSYSAKLSDDNTKLSGTFTMKLDGSKFSFNLTKK